VTTEEHLTQLYVIIAALAERVQTLEQASGRKFRRRKSPK
jgi:hypothetical protein